MILIHPGYPKTATTWLQKELFIPNHGFGQLTRDNGQRFGSHFTSSPAKYDPSVVRLSATDKLSKAASEGVLPVVTCEGLTGGFRRFTDGLDGMVIARRLADIFQDARVLIGIREQVSMIMSYYNQYLRHFGTKSIVRYVEEFNGKSAEFQSLQDFCYDRVISTYQELFGRDHVMVYTFEEFRTEPRSVLMRFHEFMHGSFNVDGIDTETMYNSKAGEYLSYGLTRWMGLPGKWMTGVQIKKHGEVVKRIRRILAGIYPDYLERRFVNHQRNIVQRLSNDIFARSNRVTAEIAGLDLLRYGYAF